MDTSERVAALRKLMQERGVTAYVIDSGDAHYSEYVAETDKRRVSVLVRAGSRPCGALDGQSCGSICFTSHPPIRLRVRQ